MDFPFKSRGLRAGKYGCKITLALIVLVACLLIGKHWFFAHKPLTSPPAKLVETLTIRPQNIQQTVRLIGTIHPKHATVLTAKGSGTLDVLVTSGQKIKKGGLIARIDNPDVEKNLQLSQATEMLAKGQFDRFSPLLKSGYVSAREAEEKKQAWFEAQKALTHTKIELANLRFYAPFDGIIGAYKKREGTQVSEGEAIVTIYDPSSLVVDFDIPCTNLKDINVGQEVHVDKKTYSLSRMQKMLDEETHMCPAEVDIACNDCLVGDSVDVDLVVAEKKKTIVVPYQALFLKNSKPAVYVVEQGKVVLVMVTTGIKQQDNIEIMAGLKPGQLLIIKGQERLYPALAVDIYQPVSPRG